jgi:hypothetical protein
VIALIDVNRLTSNTPTLGPRFRLWEKNFASNRDCVVFRPLLELAYRMRLPYPAGRLRLELN